LFILFFPTLKNNIPIFKKKGAVNMNTFIQGLLIVCITLIILAIIAINANDKNNKKK